MRAAIQPLLAKILPGWDIIIIARQAMKKADYSTTQDALLNLLDRANLISKPNGT